MAKQYVFIVDESAKPFESTDVEQLDSLYTGLNGAEFPMKKTELMDRFGQKKIYWTENKTLSLSEILALLPQEEFGSLSELSAVISSISADCF